IRGNRLILTRLSTLTIGVFVKSPTPFSWRCYFSSPNRLRICGRLATAAFTKGLPSLFKKVKIKMSKPAQDVIDKALFYDIPDMATALKCSPRHVTNLRNRQEIPQPVKLGARVLWPRKTIEDWIAAGCRH